jgi:hypothetical protein
VGGRALVWAHVLGLDALAVDGWGRVPLQGKRQPVVEVACLQLRRPIGVHLEHRRHQPLDAAAGLRRKGDHRRATDLRQHPLGVFDEVLEGLLRIGDEVPLGQHEHQATTLALDQVGDLQILGLEGVGGVHHQDHHLGEGDGADRVLRRQPFQLLVDLGLAAQAGGVDQADLASVPFPVDRNGVPGDARLWPDEEAILADQPVDQRGLARVRPPDDGDLDGVVAELFLIAFGRLVDRQRLVELGHALAVLGGDLKRLAETKVVGLESPRGAGVTLGLVGGQDHRLGCAAKDLAEHAVERNHAFAGVDQEQADVRFFDGPLCLGAHPRFQALVGDILEAGGVDQLQLKVADSPRAEAPVASHARAVVDDRQLLAGEAVEQGRFADIGAADDGEFEGHAAFYMAPPSGWRPVPPSRSPHRPFR